MLSFDDVDVGDSSDNETAAVGVGMVVEEEEDVEWFDLDEVVGGLPAGCVWEVMRRLAPADVMLAAGVCKGWREVAGRVLKAAEEIRIRVPGRGSVGFVGTVLRKCSGLVRISIRMERFDFDLI